MTEIEELRLELDNLKKDVKAQQTQLTSSPGGTIAALASLLLDPFSPRISLGPSSPAPQYPAQFKIEITQAFGNQDTATIFCKSSFTANQDWEQVASIGVSGSIGFLKTLFASNYIKFLPSGTGEAEIGVDLAPFGNQYNGLILTGKVTSGGPPTIVLTGAIEQRVGQLFTQYSSLNNDYFQITPKDASNPHPQLKSSTGAIQVAKLILNALQITAADQITFGSGWQSYTPVVTGSAGMTASLIPGTDLMKYLRIGPIVFMNGSLGITTAGTPSNYLNVSLPINSSISSTFFYSYAPVRGAYGAIPSGGGVQNSTQQIVLFAGGSDNINWPNGDHNCFFTMWYACA